MAHVLQMLLTGCRVSLWSCMHSRMITKWLQASASSASNARLMCSAGAASRLPYFMLTLQSHSLICLSLQLHLQLMHGLHAAGAAARLPYFVLILCAFSHIIRLK